MYADLIKVVRIKIATTDTDCNFLFPDKKIPYKYSYVWEFSLIVV